MTGNFVGRGSQYIQLVKVLYWRLLTNDKQLPAFPLEVRLRTELRSQRWEARMLPFCHNNPRRAWNLNIFEALTIVDLHNYRVSIFKIFLFIFMTYNMKLLAPSYMNGFNYSGFDNIYPNLLLKTDCLSLLVNISCPICTLLFKKCKNKLKQRILLFTSISVYQYN